MTDMDAAVEAAEWIVRGTPNHTRGHFVARAFLALTARMEEQRASVIEECAKVALTRAEELAIQAINFRRLVQASAAETARFASAELVKVGVAIRSLPKAGKTEQS